MFHEYPKALVRGEGEGLVVADADEEAAARKDGWRFWSDDETSAAPKRGRKPKGEV